MNPSRRVRCLEYNPFVPPRDRLYRTEAVVLRRQDLGEADRLLTLYTPGRGKLRVVAKGVRLPRSRKAGHLELFTRVDLLVARGRELDVVTQAEALQTYDGLRRDLVRFGHAAYAVELVDCFGVEEENRPLYRLLTETLERLADGEPPGTVLRFFELRLLELAGYRPQLFSCVSCNAEIRPQAQYFSGRDGGVLCPKCGSGRKQAQPISLAALKVLRHFQRSSYAAAAAVRVGRATQAEVQRLMEEYLTHLLERRLHTPAFLRRLRGLLQGEVEAA
ncbi:MAG: DNA repair protein RecO [Chloroflexota bacterium]